MKRLRIWFRNLAHISRTSILGSLALSGLFVASAMTPATVRMTTTPADPTPNVRVDAKKEPVVTTKTETETQPIPFAVQAVQSSTIAKGLTEVQATGVVGEKTIVHTITLTDGVETNRTSTESVTTAPVTEVVATGTYVKPVSSCDANYSGCVPIVSYDLDCKDIGFKVKVLGDDTHHFDRDGDGVGCESY